MPASAHDPRGYYRALNLSPGANDAEIRLAYTFLKNTPQKDRTVSRVLIKEAFDCLSDPAQKRVYDAGRLGRPDRSWVTAAVGGVVLAALLLFAGFVFPGFLVSGPGSYQSGDYLVHQVDQAPLGQVVRREAEHRFANGRPGDAYLVQHEDGTVRWYPTGDLEAHYRRR